MNDHKITESSDVAVVIAPFTPDADPIDLGASQKISLVIRALASLGYSVHLVDSSHSREVWSTPQRGDAVIAEGCEIRLWRPMRLPMRALGKLANFLWLHNFDRDLAHLRPAAVWVYNSYAYEARLALRVNRRLPTRLVFELEDLPTARKRGFSPKPWLDSLFFRPLLRRATTVTFVNDVLKQRYEPVVAQALLLPSILGCDLKPISGRPRFTEATTTVGYFGGLEHEKGADTLLASLDSLPSTARLLVTGSGSLSDRFRVEAERQPTKLAFYGQVSRDRLVSLMGQCDVIVNPHRSIHGMANGVFPFKVFEGIASGALIVSTGLPSVADSLTGAILEYDGTPLGLVNAIEKSREYYRQHSSQRVEVRDTVWHNYDFESFRKKVREITRRAAS